MAKYIERDAASGRLREVLAAEESTGIPDAGRVVALDEDGLIDDSMLPSNLGQNSVTVDASEALAVGDLVEVFDDAGTAKARKASATGVPAVGFVQDAVAQDDPVEVFLEGQVPGQSGLLPGQRLYLSETDGLATVTPVVTSGALHQFVGKAVSDTSFNFEPDDVIELA